MSHLPSYDLDLDVTAALPFVSSPTTLRATVWPAEQPQSVLVCWPGGSYSRAYWDVHVDGRDGYSFAEHVVGRGFTVVALDPLGVGESSRPEDVDQVTLESMADAATSAVRQLRERLAPAGVPVIGIGHSLGGCLTLVEQARHGSYDAVANLGFTHGAKPILAPDSAGPDPEALTIAVEHAKAFFGGDWDSGYARAPREPNHAWLHDPDVPADVIAEDDRHASAWPRQSYVGALLAGHSASYAGQVASPVFVAFGEHDVPEHPHDDIGYYGASGDVTLMVLPASAHCHNFAGTRALLWDRLADWATGIRPAT
ncbi:alpha/beta hydrolase [Aeromicrobium ginsengisoli]|uniref:Alpha/beta hydrolase n=1 Tax=Aeromicrobium ginsengisoli TaxID=363867 RepID=A0A5M4FEK5_9ACTN|nr:alpha/beta fold hydrolase [Aeromicrobium ginsengisoli]KAA1397630.1 alpha/beta hydrolase [Aeromicrobium ginsengisoli]